MPCLGLKNLADALILVRLCTEKQNSTIHKADWFVVQDHLLSGVATVYSQYI